MACLSLAVSAGTLAGLAVLDFRDPGLIVPVLLAVLGLALSIDLSASSIAIMGAAEPSEAGAAGSLEATGYELDSGLGITLFGVLMSVVFERRLVLSDGGPAALADQASRSIGDAYVAAQHLGPGLQAAVIAAGKAAFSATHSVLLTTAALLMGLMTGLVFFLLSSARPKAASWH